MIWAASKGDLTVVQHLIARGADLNRADYDGRTPLHLAAAEGRTEVVEFFIKHGANLSPEDRWGGTPVHDAEKGKHQGIAELLARAMSN